MMIQIEDLTSSFYFLIFLKIFAIKESSTYHRYLFLCKKLVGGVYKANDYHKAIVVIKLKLGLEIEIKAEASFPTLVQYSIVPLPTFHFLSPLILLLCKY